MRLKNRFKLFNYYFLKRILAYGIDFVLIKILSQIFCAIFTIGLFKLVRGNLEIHFTYADLAQNAQFILTYLTYFFLCFYIYNGQTIGLSIFNLQVKQNGFNTYQINFYSCLNRSMANYISHHLYFLPFFIALFNTENKTTSDYFSDTGVSYYSPPPEKNVKNNEELKIAS